MHDTSLRLFIKRENHKFKLTLSGKGIVDIQRDLEFSESTLKSIYDALERISITRQTDVVRKAQVIPVDSTPTLINYADLLSMLGKVIFNDVIGDLKEQFLGEDTIALIISSDDFTIPWEIMHDGEQFLSLKFPITRKVQLANPPKSHRLMSDDHELKALLIGDPSETLPEAQREVNTIADLLHKNVPELIVNVEYGRNVNRLRLLSTISDYDFIHYTGHASYDTERPDRSSIVLYDGKLPAFEIARALAKNPPLVAFINACETSRMDDWRQFQYEGRIAGVASSFISAGVLSFIGSTWPVHDFSAAFYANEFYTRLLQGNDIGTSAFMAKLETFKKYGDSEISWASFILFGEIDAKLGIEQALSVKAGNITSTIDQSAQWLIDNRSKNDTWWDEVFPERGLINTSEVIEILLCAHKINQKWLKEDIDYILTETDSTGYKASPYFNDQISEDFNTTVVSVMYALAKVYSTIEEDALRERIRQRIEACINWILSNQQDDGGWSWGVRDLKVPSYTYYSSNSIYYLTNTLQLYPISDVFAFKVGRSVQKGLNFLLSSQHEDGGWAYIPNFEKTDIISTGYAMESLGYFSGHRASFAKSRAMSFIEGMIKNHSLNEIDFEVEIPLINPVKEEHDWPRDQDYGGEASVLNGLLSCWNILQYNQNIKKLSYSLASKIITSKDPKRGWPKTYSTIYATAYSVHVLDRMRQILWPK